MLLSSTYIVPGEGLEQCLQFRRKLLGCYGIIAFVARMHRYAIQRLAQHLLGSFLQWTGIRAYTGKQVTFHLGLPRT
ncbi:hypothetical protein AXW85_30970 [Pseudomonas aeruginosa]|nr:hypothetical protein AXW85_30970 [Pseudomonas aeruginosa]